MKKLLIFLLLAGVLAVAIGWAILRKSEPPHVPFADVKRQTLVSTLPTNGKVEPFEWQPVRAETSGLVSKLEVHEGSQVAAGAVVATVSDPSAQAGIDSAEAKLAEARAGLAALQAGGRPSEISDIESQLTRLKADLAEQTTEYETLKRLSERQVPAATAQEVRAAKARMQQTDQEIVGLNKRRASLVAPADVTAAQARIQEAEAALRAAQKQSALSVVKAPISGVVYGLEARAGSYLNAGDLIGNIGRMDRLRVRVYVDEPELGRVAQGQPVTITWQALTGRKWEGTVERKPTAIVALGSRQVGEVICDIANPGRELIPGTNVDAEIRTAVVDNALVIPREALRKDTSGNYVFLLKGDVVERRPVQTGVSSITLVQVVSGLSEGDAVAMPSEVALKAGDRVTRATQ